VKERRREERGEEMRGEEREVEYMSESEREMV